MLTTYHRYAIFLARIPLWLSLKATNYKLRFLIRVYYPLVFPIRKAWMIAGFAIRKNWLIWRIRRAKKRLGISTGIAS